MEVWNVAIIIWIILLNMDYGNVNLGAIRRYKELGYSRQTIIQQFFFFFQFLDYYHKIFFGGGGEPKKWAEFTLEKTKISQFFGQKKGEKEVGKNCGSQTVRVFSSQQSTNISARCPKSKNLVLSHSASPLATWIRWCCWNGRR